VGRSDWASFFCRERIDNAWAYKPAPEVTRESISVAELAALEGEPRLFFHTRRERNPALVEAKRAAAIDALGRLQCEACGFAAAIAYPGLDVEICEVHHRRPLSDTIEAVQTRLEDLAILCPNCHRAIHQTRPMPTVEDFRNRLRRGERIGGLV
jgi:5-methylcytosine-specific restriction enzyme A